MVWFPDGERAIATSLSSMSNLLGIALSFIISPVIVPEDEPSRGLDFFFFFFDFNFFFLKI